MGDDRAQRRGARGSAGHPALGVAPDRAAAGATAAVGVLADGESILGEQPLGFGDLGRPVVIVGEREPADSGELAQDRD